MSMRKLMARTVLAHPWITLVSALILTLLSVYVTVQRLSFTSTRSALVPLKGRLAQPIAQLEVVDWRRPLPRRLTSGDSWIP